MARTQTAASAELDRRLARLFAAAPAEITVNSEVRSRAEQQKLYDAYIRDPKHNPPAAKPGSSKHESGNAADLHFATPALRKWAHDNAAKFGLVFPLGNEPWHVEVAGARSGTVAAANTTTTGGPVTDKQIRDYVISHYGYAASYLHDKEIGPILLDAAKRGLGADELRGKLSATKWWKTHTDSQVTWDMLNEQNPAEARDRVAKAAATIGAAARTAGIQLTPLQVHDLAVLYNRNKWNDDQLNNAMHYQAKIDPNVVKADFGQYAGLAQTNPEIKDLLNKAVAQQWTQAQFNQAVQGTNWFRTTNENTRNYQLGTANDPATTRQNQQTRHDQVITLARNLGVPDADPRLSGLADQAFINGWDDTTVTRKLADLVKVDPTGKANTGKTAVTLASLKEQAASYMVPMADATLAQWVNQIDRGDIPPASFDTYLKEQAKSLFPGMSHAIDSGLTVAQYVDPYKQYAAQTLEVDPESIDFLHDPKMARALFNTDPKTGERTQMSLSDWQTYLRTLPEYNKTAQATSQAADMAMMLTTKLGKVA